jgi:hypothetical protein
MTNAATHVIRRETLELTIRRRDAARALQKDARRILTSDALPALEDALASAAEPDETIVLDRIDLDLGRLSSDSFAGEFLERLRNELRDAVATAVRGLRSRDDRTSGAIVPSATFSIEVLRRFLLTGRMPWWVAGGSRVRPQQLLVDALEREPRALVAVLRALPSARTAKRLVLQFDAAAVERTIVLLAHAHGDRIARVIADWLRLLTGSPASPLPAATIVAERAREHAIELLIDADVTCTVEAFCVELITRLARDAGVDTPTLLTSLADAAGPCLPADSLLGRWLSSAIGAIEPFDGDESRSTRRGARAKPPRQRRDLRPPQTRYRTAGPATEQPGRPQIHRREPLHAGDDSVHAQGDFASATPDIVSHDRTVTSRVDPAAAPLEGERLATIAAATVDKSPFEPADEEALYVDNAGLVLVWPFLTRYFNAVGLLRDGCFTSPAAQERAVLLLHYVATGSVDAPEQQLVVPKLLAGWRDGDPVGSSIDLTENERRETGDLLASILENWSALKGTSADGFRGAFLQREGRLARGESGWELLVARVGYDVLLDRLPWGISLVVLPWMPQPLFVEW